MARRLVSARARDEAGNYLGGSGTQIRVYTDEALTTAATTYVASAGGTTQPSPLTPNAGVQTSTTVNPAAPDTTVTVADVTGFQVGDLQPIYDGTNTVYRVITAINAGTKVITLSAALGVAFAGGATVGNADMEGHVYFWLDDTQDYYLQQKDTASSRVMPPIILPVRVPATSLAVQEEGISTGAARSTLNFIGGTITAADDNPNTRVNVTVAAGPDNASYVTTAAEAGLSNEKVLGTAVIMRGLIGSRPAAAIAGLLYESTDETPPTVYRDNGASWDAIAFKDPLTTRGDLIVRTAAGTTRLAIGANTRVLTSDGTDPSWQLPTAGLNVQTFISSGTWTKPASAKVVCAIVIGGGADGAAGGVGNAGTGGGGGARVEMWLDASALGATENVTVAAAGGSSSVGTAVTAFGGGAGFTGNNASGGAGGGRTAAGQAGQNNAASAGGNAAAFTGPHAVGAAGAGCANLAAGGNAEDGGGAGGGLTNGGAGLAGGSSLNGGGGGGSGGQGTNVGAAGGANNSYAAGGGGAAGNPGAAGTSRSLTGRAGDGGGGGNANGAGAGGAGGAGGVPGGGGGGGGQGTTAGGAAGAGSRGEVLIYTWS